MGEDTPPLVRDGRYTYFSDIDYGDKTVSLWQCRKHLSRLRYIIAARGDGDGPAEDDIIAGIDFWVDSDFTNPNWWHNRIGTPSDLGAICLLLGDRLRAERLGEGWRKKSSREDHFRTIPAFSKIRAQICFGVRITIYYALLTGDENLLSAASNRFAEEIKTDGFEGIKPDFSFHQHGPQLYSCGYGRSFTDDAARG